MKIKRRTNRRAGIMLMECLVYLGVFAVLLGGGTAVFYFCWDHTRATVLTADDVQTVLLEGEQWRKDVRAATGKISIQTTPTGEMLKIPVGQMEIVYRQEAGELRREIPAQKRSKAFPVKVKTSEMKPEVRGGVAAWRWELELMPPRKETHLPLLFTFEAVPGTL
jgi:hypothetical protein